MPSDNHQDVVRAVIDENRYLSLATTDGEKPWVAPVEYVVDDELNFYFVSLVTSRHVNHIQGNPLVAVAIFDSRQPSFTGRGIQIDGRVSTYSDHENPFVTIAGRDMPEDLSDFDPDYAAFKIEPQHFYVVKGHVQEEWKDERLEVAMDV